MLPGWVKSRHVEVRPPGLAGEHGVLRDLAKAVPEHAAALLDMADRTVGLLPVAKAC